MPTLAQVSSGLLVLDTDQIYVAASDKFSLTSTIGSVYSASERGFAKRDR